MKIQDTKNVHVRSINVSPKLFAKIEGFRAANGFGFDVSEDDLLLLMLDAGVSAASAPEASSTLPGWLSHGVLLPNGTDLRMSYQNRQATAVVRDGKIEVTPLAGVNMAQPVHKSLSGAAGAVASAIAGKSINIDGWIYWEVRRPGDVDWNPCKELRAQVSPRPRGNRS